MPRHKPPSYYRIQALMLDFCRDLAERLRHLPPIDDQIFLDSLIDLLAWAHHRFLWIHPFKDFNGRIGRLLINIILLNLELPPIELRVETRSGRGRYINALQNADQGDYHLLKKLIIETLEEAARKLGN